MTHGNRGASDYALEFRTLAADRGWNKPAFKAAYHQGLNLAILSKIACPLMSTTSRIIHPQNSERKHSWHQPHWKHANWSSQKSTFSKQTDGGGLNYVYIVAVTLRAQWLDQLQPLPRKKQATLDDVSTLPSLIDSGAAGNFIKRIVTESYNSVFSLSNISCISKFMMSIAYCHLTASHSLCERDCGSVPVGVIWRVTGQKDAGSSHRFFSQVTVYITCFILLHPYCQGTWTWNPKWHVKVFCLLQSSTRILTYTNVLYKPRWISPNNNLVTVFAFLFHR